MTNATLEEIAKPGPLQGNGDPGEPVSVWKGHARGYLKRIRRMAISGGVNVQVKRDVFVILNSAGAPAIEHAGTDWEAHTVVIADQRTGQVKRRRYAVRGMENRAIGSPVDSIRLELDPEGAA